MRIRLRRFSTFGTLKHFQDSNKPRWLQEALLATEMMQQQGISISNQQAYFLLRECTKQKDLQSCRRILSLLTKNGLDSYLILVDHLIRLFAACDSLIEANCAFNKALQPSHYTWNAIISAHAKLGYSDSALKFYHMMLQSHTTGDKYVVVGALQACFESLNCYQGRLIHQDIIENDLQLDVVVGTAILDMYLKCTCLEEAEEVFDNIQNRNVVSWTAMITGHARCGNLEAARRLFDEMPDRNVVSWGAIISGYAQHGEGFLALECFRNMQVEGLKPNRVIFLSTLRACASIGAIDQGKDIYKQILECGIELDDLLANTFVDMYAKCGCLKEAQVMFDTLEKRDVVSWNAMIAGYAHCGDIELAKLYLQEMQQEGIKPNNVTFAIMLAALSRAGLVEEGHKYFKSMQDHGVATDIHLNTCMIDLLGRAGHLDGAKNLLQNTHPNIFGWRSLLTACKMYTNVDLGRLCFERIVKLDPCNAAGYVLMSGIYLDAHMWNAAAEMEELRERAGAWKKPAKAWIEISNKVHEFIVGDKSHMQIEEIYARLRSLHNQMEEQGYIRTFDLLPEKDALCGHCERLAIAFGLITTPLGTAIRVTKNVRMCIDCHDTTKIISKIERREIVIRDAYCLHHFKDGYCACRNSNY